MSGSILGECRMELPYAFINLVFSPEAAAAYQCTGHEDSKGEAVVHILPLQVGRVMTWKVEVS